MGKERTTLIRLAPGMTEMLPGGRPGSIHVRAGRLRVRFPAVWLAGSVVMREQVMVEGDSQPLTFAGDVQVTALAAVEVLLIDRAGWASNFCGWIAAWARKLSISGASSRE